MGTNCPVAYNNKIHHISYVEHNKFNEESFKDWREQLISNGNDCENSQ